MTTTQRTAGRDPIRQNNFDLIRLAAASQVVLFHGLEHLGPDGASHTVLGRLLSWFPGVPIFFVISGFLVSLYYERSPSVAEYLRNRALRIFPALWFCLLLSIGSLLLFALPLEPQPSVLGFLGWILAQLSFLQFYNPDFLRGYGVGVLNGSLWTIPVELQFYIFLPLLYKVVRHRRRVQWTWIGMSLSALLLSLGIGAWASAQGAGPLTSLAYVSVLPYLYLFLLGVLLQRNYARLALWIEGRGLHWLAIYCAACVVSTMLGWRVGNNDSTPLLAVLLGVTTISLAFSYRPLSESLLRANDISYGTYIYHMPIVNALLATGLSGQLRWVVAMASLTYLLAFLSWRLVELPCLRHKHSALRARGRAVGAPRCNG